MAREPPAFAVTDGCRSDVRKLVAPGRLVGGESDLQLARGDLRQQRLLDRVASGIAKQPTAQHHRTHVRLQQQSLAHQFHDGHDVHTAAAEPAEFLGIGQAEQAEIGILSPGLRGIAERRARERAAPAALFRDPRSVSK